jgi:hypothetical protein
VQENSHPTAASRRCTRRQPNQPVSKADVFVDPAVRGAFVGSFSVKAHVVLTAMVASVSQEVNSVSGDIAQVINLATVEGKRITIVPVRLVAESLIERVVSNPEVCVHIIALAVVVAETRSARHSKADILSNDPIAVSGGRA